MTEQILAALAVFALVTVITPGPNNLMLMASGANFGFRRTIPHMLGVGLGFPAMVAMIGLGAMRVFDRWPLTRDVLSVVSVAYLLWLAWKITQASAPGSGDSRARPLSFLQAAAFQWVNPKAWSMGLGAITLYATNRDPVSVAWVAGTYVLMSAISTTTWTVMGQGLRRFLTSPGRLRAFNWTMAALLVGSMAVVLMD